MYIKLRLMEYFEVDYLARILKKYKKRLFPINHTCLTIEFKIIYQYIDTHKHLIVVLELL